MSAMRQFYSATTITVRELTARRGTTSGEVVGRIVDSQLEAVQEAINDQGHEPDWASLSIEVKPDENLMSPALRCTVALKGNEPAKRPGVSTCE